MSLSQYLSFVFDRFKEKNWRLTLGTRQVCENLFQEKTMISVQDFSKNIKKNPVSVYRILHKLEAIGLAHEFEGKWKTCSDPENQVDQHHFLVCHKCGSGEEIFLDYHSAIAGELQKEKGFTLERVALGFHGVCKDCL